eukprot:TRINITY_DN10899_c0_g1_i1.p1 TRINITY_DN10899_c0_g1~~TRINITY_DN10899_c0_g1_i1.p1  ORF type:complete len:192 (+),score=26.19 TRINITY_DN10899_c0_g1_i1:1-576(+)
MEWAHSITLVSMDRVDMLLEVFGVHWARQSRQAKGLGSSFSREPERMNENASPPVQVGGTPVRVDFAEWVNEHYPRDRELYHGLQAMGGAVHLTRSREGTAGVQCINRYGGSCLQEWNDRFVQPDVLDARACYPGNYNMCVHPSNYFAYLRKQSVEYTALRSCERIKRNVGRRNKRKVGRRVEEEFFCGGI